MRISRTGGTTYTLSYSADNVSWTQVQQYFDVNLGATPKVGLIAQNAAGLNVDYDWFELGS